MAFGLLQMDHKSGQTEWHLNLPAWRHPQIFLTLFCFLVIFCYWSTFHVNIITGPGVTVIFFYKGLTRNPEIGNIPVWVLPYIGKLTQVMDTNFGMDSSNEMLLNPAKYQICSFCCFWVITAKPIERVK